MPFTCSFIERANSLIRPWIDDLILRWRSFLFPKLKRPRSHPANFSVFSGKIITYMMNTVRDPITPIAKLRKLSITLYRYILRGYCPDTSAIIASDFHRVCRRHDSTQVIKVHYARANHAACISCIQVIKNSQTVEQCMQIIIPDGCQFYFLTHQVPPVRAKTELYILILGKIRTSFNLDKITDM